MNTKGCKFVLGIILSHLLWISASAQVSFGHPEKINRQWKFTLSDPQEAKQLEYEDAHWQTVDLPHDWSIKGRMSPHLASATGYLPGGIGWYRKVVRIPADKRQEKVFLYFEGIYNRSEIYVNGHLLGKRPNGYVSFMLEATPYIRYGADNVIAVRVDHSRSADSRWYTGSGIYRNVWLIYADPVHIAQWGVYAYPEQVSVRKAILNVAVELENQTTQKADLTVENELISPEQKVVARQSRKLTVEEGKKATATCRLNVTRPRLWDLEHPELYRLKTTVFKAGKVIDQTVTTTGFRSFTFDPDKGFALNGRWMKVKGVCIHHDAGVLGAAVPEEVWRTRLLKLKEMGCNAIRTTHNPQAPALYELCDELGLLVLNEAFDEWEFPKRKWLEGWNVGTPGLQGSYDFFEEWGEKDLADMVRRDRNHVSVFAWSIGNEVDYPNDPYSHPILGGEESGGFTQAIYGGYKKEAPDAMPLGAIAKRLAAVVKRYDRSRPVTAGLAGVAMSNETEYPEALDITGYNYTESRYLSDHRKYPERVIFGSENRHDLEAWKAVRDNEHIFGQFLWTGIDYLGEAGRWPSRGLYTGLLDFCGEMKPRGYYRQALWSDTPMAYLGTYPVWNRADAPSMDAWPVWNYEPGQLIRVVCYTNQEKARLELNGERIGELKKYDQQTGIIYWDIPYAEGKLEVIGLNAGGEEVVRKAIRSSGRPYALRVEEVVPVVITPQEGVAQIRLQVVDEQGNPVVLADNEITCQVMGDARLLGLESGNNEDTGDYTDRKQRVYHGRLLAYIQAGKTEGTIRVKFTSPLLKSAEIDLEIRTIMGTGQFCEIFAQLPRPHDR